MNINPGKLNKKIDIVTVYERKNQNGFPIYEEKTYKADIWAAISQKSANEIFKANSTFATSQKRFLIRYVPGISYDMLIRYKDVLYDIKYINDYEDKNEYIEIIAEVSDLNGKISS